MGSYLKRLVMDTPLEGYARGLYTRFSRSKGSYYERQMLAVMKRCLRRDSSCIDIGAYRGGVLREIMRIAPEGEHFAFEPVPDQHAYLAKQFPGVHTHQLALSDTKGEVSFCHVVESPTRSGFMYASRQQEHVEIIKVWTDCLDNIIQPDRPVSFVKIDVEGAEWRVIRGAKRTLRTHQPVVVFECGLQAMAYYQIEPQQLYDVLTRECELNISLMPRFLRGETPLTRGEFVDNIYQGRNYCFVAHRRRACTSAYLPRE